MKRFAAAVLLALFAVPAWSQDRPAIRFVYSNPQLKPASWMLTMYPDGSAHFRTGLEEVAASSSHTAKQSTPGPAGIDRDLRLSPAFVQQAFDTAHTHQNFQAECESHLKVAFTGQKRLSYLGPDGSGNCEFNYSKDKQIQALADAMISTGNTILTGAKLETLLAHDRLGLDKEIAFLAESANRGNAQQLCAIREILLRLASDDAVLYRVKRQARLLLDRAEK